MTIISVEIMKIVDEREMQKKTEKKTNKERNKQRQTRAKGNRSYSERFRAK